MAEPLKNSFGPDVAARVASMILSVHPDFDEDSFLTQCLDGFDDLELMPRARRISDALADHLPADRGRALKLITDCLDHKPEESADANIADERHVTGMEGFRFQPFVSFVGEHGLEHFEPAMTLQYELTQRFTAEFSIRSYLEHHEEATLARLEVWATDPSEHVRRLVSEGTRPRLPWAPRLRRFQEDPAPVVALLERLKDDPQEYVRRSVANNLNDIAKDHPALVVEITKRWWADGDRNRRRLIRHGLRTLIKQGDPAALDVLGYGPDSPAQMSSISIEPASVQIGGKIRIEVTMANPSDATVGALVDLRVHFVKANGSTSAKVFKGAEPQIEPGGSAVIRKTISVAQHSTRVHYPGVHRVEVLINGTAHDAGTFELTT